MKKYLYIMLLYLSAYAYADTYSDYDNLTDNSGGGNIVATMIDENPYDWEISATPINGYKFGYWNDFYGTIESFENPIRFTIDRENRNYGLQAVFVKDDAFIGGWLADSIIVRSLSTYISDSDMGKAVLYVDEGELEENIATPVRLDHGIWRFYANDLFEDNKNAGKNLHIVLLNECDEPTSVINTVVPYIVNTECNADTISFASARDVEVLSDGILNINANTVIAGNLNIHPGGKVVVQNGNNLTVNGIIMQGNGITKKWPQLVVNGTINNNNSNTIYYDYTIDQSQYYPFSLPYEVAGASMMGPVGGRIPACIVYSYSGENREEGKNGWVKYSHKTGSFEAGKGYAIISQPLKWNDTRQQEAIVRFPMVADLSSGEEEERLIDINTNASSKASAQDRNWNCIGNPYLANIEMGYQPYNVEGTVFAHQGFVNGSSFDTQAIGMRSPKYFTYSNDGFYTYIQDDFEHFVLLPFNSYFTQTSYGDKIMFGKIHAAAAPQRLTEEEEGNLVEDLKTGILLTQDERSDRINLLFNDYFTYDYELNADLVKMFGSAQPLSAYSLMTDATPLAFQALPMEAINRPIQVGYRKADMSPMTFSFDDSRYDRNLLEALWLTDQVTGKVTNLMLEDYTFMPEATQDDNRFFLSLEKRKVVDVTTAVDEVNQERTITHIYDMLGREINTSYNMLPQGVYVITDNLGTTRKEIIR